MAVLLVTLVAGLLLGAESQASDAATPQGFLSKYVLSDADGDYNQFITPTINHMKLGKGPDALLSHNIDKEEEKAAQKMLAGNNDTPISLSTIGAGCLAFMTLLVARMRGGSDASINITPGLADHLMEMKSQGRHSMPFDPLDLSKGIAQSPVSEAHAENLREAEVDNGRIAMLAASQVDKFRLKLASAAAAAAFAMVPTAAFADSFLSMQMVSSNLPTSTIAKTRTITREGLYGDYTVEIVDEPNPADDARSTFKSRAQTKKGKNKYLGLFVVLLFGSFVIPMMQYFWYVRDTPDSLFAQNEPPPPPPPAKKKFWER